MAARRLLILMLILLGISSVFAVLIPNPRRDAREQEARQDAGSTGATGSTDATITVTPPAGTTGGATPQAPEASVAGGPVRATVEPDGRSRTIKVKPEGRLILTVESSQPSQVTIPGLGLTGFADRWAPAVFDTLLPLGKERIPVYVSPPDFSSRTRRAVIDIRD